MKGNYIDISLHKKVTEKGIEMYSLITPFYKDKNETLETTGTTYQTRDMDQFLEWLIEIGKDNKEISLRAYEEVEFKCEGDE